MVVLHNAFDGIRVMSWQGPGSPVPTLRPSCGSCCTSPQSSSRYSATAGLVVQMVYPLVPWIGVIAVGYVFGKV